MEKSLSSLPKRVYGNHPVSTKQCQAPSSAKQTVSDWMLLLVTAPISAAWTEVCCSGYRFDRYLKSKDCEDTMVPTCWKGSVQMSPGCQPVFQNLCLHHWWRQDAHLCSRCYARLWNSLEFPAGISNECDGSWFGSKVLVSSDHGALIQMSMIKLCWYLWYSFTDLDLTALGDVSKSLSIGIGSFQQEGYNYSNSIVRQGKMRETPGAVHSFSRTVLFDAMGFATMARNRVKS